MERDRVSIVQGRQDEGRKDERTHRGKEHLPAVEVEVLQAVLTRISTIDAHLSAGVSHCLFGEYLANPTQKGKVVSMDQGWNTDVRHEEELLTFK